MGESSTDARLLQDLDSSRLVAPSLDGSVVYTSDCRASKVQDDDVVGTDACKNFPLR